MLDKAIRGIVSDPTTALLLSLVLAFAVWGAWTLVMLRRQIQRLERQLQGFRPVEEAQPSRIGPVVEKMEEQSSEAEEAPDLSEEATSPGESILAPDVESALPINEDKLEAINFSAVLADPKRVGLPSLQETTESHVHLHFDGLGDFVAKCGAGLTSDGMIVTSTDSKEPGTQLQLEVRIKGGYPLIQGIGKVTRLIDSPEKGMEIRFVYLDEASRRLISKIIGQREQSQV